MHTLKSIYEWKKPVCAVFVKMHDFLQSKSERMDLALVTKIEFVQNFDFTFLILVASYFHAPSWIKSDIQTLQSLKTNLNSRQCLEEQKRFK